MTSTITGLDGTATLTDDAVVLTFKGFGAAPAKRAASPRTVPLGAVEDVELVPGTFTRPGALRLVVRGRDGYAHDARVDLNALSVGRGPDAAAFADAVRAAAAVVDEVEAFTTPAGTRPAPAYAPRPEVPDVAAPRVPVRSARFEGVKLHTDGTIEYRRDRQPVAGVTASVETAGALRTRTTATRVVAGTVLAGIPGAIIGGLARKRVDDRELYLLVEGPAFAWAVEVDPKRQADARQFAAKITTAGRASA